MTTNYKLTSAKGVSTAQLTLKMNRTEAVYLLAQLTPGDRLHTALGRQITHQPRRKAFTIVVKGPLATKMFEMFADAMSGAVADCGPDAKPQSPDPVSPRAS